jgi:hypothetical protein
VDAKATVEATVNGFFGLRAVMGIHSFIRYFVTVTVTLLVTAVTNKFLFSSACNKVMEAIGDLKND